MRGPGYSATADEENIASIGLSVVFVASEIGVRIAQDINDWDISRSVVDDTVIASRFEIS